MKFKVALSEISTPTGDSPAIKQLKKVWKRMNVLPTLFGCNGVSRRNTTFYSRPMSHRAGTATHPGIGPPINLAAQIISSEFKHVLSKNA